MTILANNLRRIFCKPINFVLMLVVPVALTFLVITATTEPVKYIIGVVDEDQSELTSSFLKKLETQAVITTLENDEKVINSALLNSEVDMALRFPKGYTQNIIDGKDCKVQTFVIQQTNQTEPMKLLIQSLSGAAREFGKAANGNSKEFYDAFQKYTKPTLTASYQTFEFTKQENINRSISSLGYLAFGMMFLISFATMLILEDKLSRVFSRILTTPTSQASYYGQHFLSYLIVALIQIVVIFNLFPKMTDLSYGEDIQTRLSVMFVTFCFALTCIAIGIMVSRFARSTSTAGALVSLVNLPMLMLGGCLWPREIMPDAVQRIGDFVPPTWFLNGAKEVLNGNGLSAASHEILYMLAFSVVLLLITFCIRTDEKY